MIMRALNRNAFSKYFQCPGYYIVQFSRENGEIFFFCLMRIYTTPDLQKGGLLWRSQSAPLVPAPYEAT